MGRRLLNRENKYPQPISQEGSKVIKLRFVPQPKSLSQELYLESLRNTPLTIGAGPAGSGKSFLAMAVGVEKLLANEVSKIVLTRPAVETGASLGYLPGDLDSKIAPYLRPLLDALEELVGPTMAKKLFDGGKIEFAPLSFCRGRTFNNCLPADHLVMLADGSYIKIAELVQRVNEGESFSVMSFNLDTQKLEPQQVQAAFKQPNQYRQLVKVTLEDGTVIQATPDHKLFTKNRGYVPVNQLNNNDELLIFDDEQNI
jgi:hypothetical protein